jgi:hypothetical protein
MKSDHLANVCPPLWSTHRHLKNPGSRDSMVRTVVMLRDGRQRNRGSIPGGERYLSLLQKTCRSALGTTQAPVQWVPGFLPGGKAGRV